MAAGQYPGSTDLNEARKKIGALLDAGITVFIDLTEEDELLGYDDVLREESEQRDVRASHIRIPIRDVSTPGNGVMERILHVIETAIETGEVAYVHCRGGIGRTGTVIGCHLVEQGISSEQSLATVQSLFEQYGRRVPPLRSPETRAQCDFVTNWVPRSLRESLAR